MGVALLLACASFLLFTRNNDFPLDYHPDEDGKVAQLCSTPQERNLNHPLLLLETANLVRRATGAPTTDPRAVAIAGRRASAMLAAIGVFAICVAAFARRGWIGLVIVGPSIALCPPLLVFAHYLKEDAALAAGLCVTMAGAIILCGSRRARVQVPATLVLAVGCAMMASAKYIGVVVFVPASLALLIAPTQTKWIWLWRIGLFAAVVFAMTVAINLRAFDDPWTLRLNPIVFKRINESIHHATTGRGGLALVQPNTFCLRAAATMLMPQTGLLLGCGIAAALSLAIIQRRWPLTRDGVVLGSTFAVFAGLLACNVLPFARYALPLSVLGYLITGSIVAATLDRWRPLSINGRRAKLAAVVACVTTLVVGQGARCLAFDHQFSHDSRQRLRTWLAKNVRPTDLVVADWYANAQTDGDPWRFPDQPELHLRIGADGCASERGPIERMERDGVRYVIVCEPSYSRFLFADIRATRGHKDWLARMAEFYRTLDERADLVWSSKPRPPSFAYVNPEIRVYRLRGPATPSHRQRSSPPPALDRVGTLLGDGD